MSKKTTISFHDLKQKIETFKNNIDTFSNENADEFERQLNDINDDIGLMFLESDERYVSRLWRRDAFNKNIREKNKQGPRETDVEYIKQDPEAFYDRLINKLGHIKNGDLYVKKLKKWDHIKDLIPVKYKPLQMVMGSDKYQEKYKDVDEYDNNKNPQNREYRSDHFWAVRGEVKQREQVLVGELMTLLNDAKKRNKNIFRRN